MATEHEVPAATFALPAGWQEVHGEAALHELVPPRGLGSPDAELGAERVETLRTILTGAITRYREYGVVFTAIRLRLEATAFDLMLLAAPPSPGTDPPISLDDNTIRRLDVDGISAVEHRGTASASQSEHELFASRLQVTSLIPGTERGVILTLASTQVDAEDLLEREARAVLGSLSAQTGEQAVAPEPAPVS